MKTKRTSKGNYTYTDNKGVTWEIEKWYAGVWTVTKSDSLVSEASYKTKRECVAYVESAIATPAST